MTLGKIEERYFIDKRVIPRTAEEIFNRAKQVQKSPAFENATSSTMNRMGKVVSANRKLKEQTNEFVWNRINALKEEIRPLEAELKKKKEELSKLEREAKGRSYRFMKMR